MTDAAEDISPNVLCASDARWEQEDVKRGSDGHC